MAEQISKDQVAHVASLAKLAFDEEGLNEFTEQLGDILSLFETLQEVDTSEVEPTYSVTTNVNHLREDQADNWHQKRELLANAPEEAADLIKVPAILKGEAEE
ncbi:Asp-tRNA(Asn)/Glu-tRNA(Gln) amidotransferase subunit GatC [Leuconostocaceae bacterium ESL0723]|nr:Asp-tRNA(Asn)/Glu-tRNA(Gln) amidotransferase subunit GatC [Leuconostocaceae bacterium ESL0723]